MSETSFYIGKVVDNQDEEGLNRIKVSANLEGEEVSYWLPYLSPIAGNGTGFSSLPEVDTQVLVVVFGLNREEQCVIGSFWGENSKPPETKENTEADLNSDGKNSLLFFKSKSGNMIISDDSEGKEKLQIIASEGKTRIEFDVANEVINIETDKDIVFSAKKNINICAEEINFTSKKSLNIKADEFNVKSEKEANIEAIKDITIKGSGIALN